MTFRVDAPAFVPKSRATASVTATTTTGTDGASAPEAVTTTGTAPEETASEAVTTAVRAGGDAASSSSEVERELREALEATQRELETSRAQSERLKAAAAQAGRLSKAYSHVDEDVKRLTRELEEKTEQCEQAWELATMRESERDDARAAAARERDGLKEDLKAALRKALSTADELHRVKQSMRENEGMSSRAEARVQALESMLRAKEDELAGAETAKSLAEARAEKLEADAASSDDAHASELAELKKLRAELSAELDVANSRAESALGECERLKNELEARVSAEANAAATIEAHAEEKATLEKTCEELRAALNASNVRVEEIVRERDGFKTELEAESSKGDLDELRGVLDAEREKTAEITKKYEENKAALDARGDDLRRARETESALSAALSDAEAQLVDSRKNVDLIVSRADKASEIFRENAAALRLADARAATAQLEASVAEERVKALEESLREVEEERDACKDELETLKKQPKLVSPTSPIASPAKTSAPIDVVEALEHERRARALFQSDARYWRERYESIANGPSSGTPILSFASPPSVRTPGSALAIAAGLPKTPTTAEIRAPLRGDLLEVDHSTEDDSTRTVEDASTSKDRTDTVDRGVENTPPRDRARAREKLAAYFR